MLLLSRVLCPPILKAWTAGGQMDKKGTLPKVAKCLKPSIYRYFPQQNLYFLPLPHGQVKLRLFIFFYLLQSLTVLQNVVRTRDLKNILYLNTFFPILQ